MKRVFFDYGIEICEEEGKYYLIFDDGVIVSHFTKIEISKADAERAMISPLEAGDVITHYQRVSERERKLKRRDDPENGTWKTKELQCKKCIFYDEENVLKCE